MNQISIAMITKNAEKHLHRCLSSLQGFDDIVILDNGSDDATIDIAKTFSNVTIYESEFIGFGPLKQLAASYTKQDWVLSLDSDETITPELEKELKNKPLDHKVIYAIQRTNHFKNRPIHCCGWDKDYVTRLFNKHTTNFNHKQVHESIADQGLEIQKLKEKIHHYPYQSIDEIITKTIQYSTLYAKDNQGIKKSSISIAFIKAFFAFIKFYFIKKGFTHGEDGLLIATSNAIGVFYKYVKLYESNKEAS